MSAAETMTASGMAPGGGVRVARAMGEAHSQADGAVESSNELRRLCGMHADRYTGTRSIHPRRLAWLGRIVLLVRRVPFVELRLGVNEEGRLIRKHIERRSLGLRTVLHEAASVLEIPPEPGLYQQGSKRQTLRRMCRKAAARGITCRSVETLEERQRLVELAIAFEQCHPDLRYRREYQNTSQLKDASLCVAAYAANGRALVVSVNPIAGETAALRFFRTLESSEDATLARYLLTAFLVDELAGAGVRNLVDVTHPIFIGSGLQHFANMVGFSIKRAIFLS
jgi:hypothetical protein